MSAAFTLDTYSPEDLLALPDGKMFELLDGRLVEKSSNVLAGFVEGLIAAKLWNHCSANQFGFVFSGTLGYQCPPWNSKTVRKPDVSLIRKSRITANLWEQHFVTIAPDLAVEVVSPNDGAYELVQKVEEYLRAGVPLVWVIDPKAQIVMIHRRDGSIAKLRAHEELTGEDVIPGFRCPISELFPPPKK